MSTHRRYQNIHVPESMRDVAERTSVSRTVRDIRAAYGCYSEIGRATVFNCECLVGTESGKFWVIVEVQTNVKAESEN